MRVIVAGSRTITSYETVNAAIAESGFDIDTVISGTAQGVDQLGEGWAILNDAEFERYPANWNKYGKSAGYKRNEQMAAVADALIAVWDGKSRGTKHMIDIMNKLGKKVYVCRIP